MTDLTGIPRLHRSVGELYRWLWNGPVRRRSAGRAPAFLDTHPIVRCAVFAYAAATVGFFAYFLHHLLWIFVPFVLLAIPSAITLLYTLGSRGDFGFEFWRTALKGLLLGASAWGCCLMLWRILLKLSDWIGLRRAARAAVSFLRPNRTLAAPGPDAAVGARDAQD